MYEFGIDRSHKQEVWGQFGDFIGGIVNPLVGLGTIFLLVLTLLDQKEELASQREQLKLQTEETRNSVVALNSQLAAMKTQAFEQSFFAWLASYRELLTSVTASPDRSIIGREALERLRTNFNGAHAQRETLPGSSFNEMIDDQFDDSPLKNYDELIANALKADPVSIKILHKRLDKSLNAYEKLFKSRRSSLDALFRTLYRLFSWIDTSGMSDEQRWHYSSLVRSQLSSAEMIFLMYNGMTSSGKKFTCLIEKYALLDNLDESSDELVAAAKKVFVKTKPAISQDDSRFWPYSKSAFCSTEARKKFKEREKT